MFQQTLARTAVLLGNAAWPHLDAVLARLTELVAAIEADCAASGATVALPRHRAALYAAMDALGGWINAFPGDQSAVPESRMLVGVLSGQPFRLSGRQ